MARRRCRHFNPATAGCQVALDARFITGIAGGGAVATWTGRPRTSVDATQATGVSQPTLQLTGINGRAAVRFDASNDVMQLNATTLFQSVGSGFILSVVADNNPTSGDAFHGVCHFSTGTDAALSRLTMHSRLNSVNGSGSNIRRLDADAVTSTGTLANSSNPAVLVSVANWSAGTGVSARNGVNSTAATLPSSGNTSNTASLLVSVGSTSALGTVSRFPGDIAVIIAASPAPATAMLKRIEHAAGRSFNIPLVA
jgi:hypothetical protein